MPWAIWKKMTTMTQQPNEPTPQAAPAAGLPLDMSVWPKSSTISLNDAESAIQAFRSYILPGLGIELDELSSPAARTTNRPVNSPRDRTPNFS